MTQVFSKSIAQTVFEQFLETGVVAVPDGEFAAAVSLQKSSDQADPKRSLHLIFADGSDVGIQASTASFSHAGTTSSDQLMEAALKIAPELDEFNGDAAVAAIQFALKDDDGMGFLRCWNEGDFDACRREWPEAPDEVYIGADPLHVPKK